MASIKSYDTAVLRLFLPLDVETNSGRHISNEQSHALNMSDDIRREARILYAALSHPNPTIARVAPAATNRPHLKPGSPVIRYKIITFFDHQSV